MATKKLEVEALPQVGDRVIAQHKFPGTIRFVGGTKFATGDWIGVELDEPHGKNDGSVLSERYFQCDQNKGLFVRPNGVKKEQQTDFRTGLRPRSLSNTGTTSPRSTSSQKRTAKLLRHKSRATKQLDGDSFNPVCVFDFKTSGEGHKLEVSRFEEKGLWQLQIDETGEMARIDHQMDQKDVSSHRCLIEFSIPTLSGMKERENLAAHVFMEWLGDTWRCSFQVQDLEIPISWNAESGVVDGVTIPEVIIGNLKPPIMGRSRSSKASPRNAVTAVFSNASVCTAISEKDDEDDSPVLATGSRREAAKEELESLRLESAEPSQASPPDTREMAPMSQVECYEPLGRESIASVAAAQPAVQVHPPQQAQAEQQASPAPQAPQTHQGQQAQQQAEPPQQQTQPPEPQQPPAEPQHRQLQQQPEKQQPEQQPAKQQPEKQQPERALEKRPEKQAKQGESLQEQQQLPPTPHIVEPQQSSWGPSVADRRKSSFDTTSGYIPVSHEPGPGVAEAYHEAIGECATEVHKLHSVVDRLAKVLDSFCARETTACEAWEKTMRPLGESAAVTEQPGAGQARNGGVSPEGTAASPQASPWVMPAAVAPPAEAPTAGVAPPIAPKSPSDEKDEVWLQSAGSRLEEKAQQHISDALEQKLRAALAGPMADLRAAAEWLPTYQG